MFFKLPECPQVIFTPLCRNDFHENLLVFLDNRTAPIGLEKLFQFCNPFLKPWPDVRVPDTQPSRILLDDHLLRMNIRSMYRILRQK